MGSKIYIAYSGPTAPNLVQKHNKKSTFGGLHERTQTHRVFILVLIIPNGRGVFSLCFFSQTNRTPEIQMIVGFLKVLASCGEKVRVWWHYNAVQPARKEKRKCEANVSCEKGLKDPEPVRFKYVAESAEGKSQTGYEENVSASGWA